MLTSNYLPEVMVGDDDEGSIIGHGIPKVYIFHKAGCEVPVSQVSQKTCVITKLWQGIITHKHTCHYH